MNLTKVSLSTITFLVICTNAMAQMPTGAPKTYPTGEVGKMVKLGEDILMHTDTHPLTKDMVGDKLQCISCHIRGSDGKPSTAHGISTFIGTATAFPAYSKREKSV